MVETDTYYKDATVQPKEDADSRSQIAALREQIGELTESVAKFASETGEAGFEKFDGAIREKPYITLGLALLAGIAIGLALRR